MSKRRLNWGFSHHGRPIDKGYLTGSEAEFIAKQRALRASDQAIADMLGIPVGALKRNVVVQEAVEPRVWGLEPAPARPPTRTPRPPKTVWIARK